MAHLVLAGGGVFWVDEGLEDLEAGHRDPSHHCWVRMRLSLAEEEDDWGGE